MSEPYDNLPMSNWQRGKVSGKTAARLCGHALKYWSRKPFRADERQIASKEEFNRHSAQILFKGLSLLRGTALKICQQLCFEFEFFPAAIRAELEKSYNQVPPINRALVRKILFNAFGASPEHIFRHFDSKAFAAASLGQVHVAEAQDGRQLAVKIQYPGIRQTIKNDLGLFRSFLRPLPDYPAIHKALAEIETVLIEETDYVREAERMQFFGSHLRLPEITVPAVDSRTSCETVLSMHFIEGATLNAWLKTNPSRQARDTVAALLNKLFLKSLYELNVIHADPNPGNFIIRKDLSVGLVDFGCVKRLKKSFIDDCRLLPYTAYQNDKDGYIRLLKKLNVFKKQVDPVLETHIYDTAYRFGQWYAGFYREDVFDYHANKDYIQIGRDLTTEIYQFRRHIDLNPDFIFLDRTRYGLMRIFEQLGARVRFRNRWEWPV